MLPAAPLLWHQLEGRVSTLFWYTRSTGRVGGTFPKDEVKEAQEIANDHKLWLKGIQAPTISGFAKFGSGWGHLICVPMPDFRPVGMPQPAQDRKLLLVAVVPIDGALSR